MATKLMGKDESEKMGDHVCKHEADIAVLQTDLATIKSDVRESKETVQQIYKILNGNGSPGIVSRVAILEDQHRTQPTIKTVMVYGTVGGGLTVALSILVKLACGG